MCQSSNSRSPTGCQSAVPFKYLCNSVMLGDVLSDTLALAPGGGCVAIVVVGIRPMAARGLVLPGDDSGRGFLRPGISSIALSTANSYTHLKFFITRRAWSDFREASCRRDIKYRYNLTAEHHQGSQR